MVTEYKISERGQFSLKIKKNMHTWKRGGGGDKFFFSVRTYPSHCMVLQTRNSLHRHENFNISRNLNMFCSTNVWVSGVPRAGLGEGVQPPPLKFRSPSKIVPNSTRLWKLLKITEFRTPTPKDVRKKGSKILKYLGSQLFYISNDK